MRRRRGNDAPVPAEEGRPGAARRSRRGRVDRRRAAFAILGTALMLTASGCGYSLVGTGSFLPEYIQTVAIPTFGNNTPRFEVEVRITDAVTREFVSRGNFSVVADQEGADALLEGTITAFSLTPIGLSQEQATNYLVTIQAQVNFRDLVQNRIIYSNNSFQFRQQFELEQDPNTFFDVSNVAVDEIAVEFARSVVASILEGF